MLLWLGVGTSEGHVQVTGANLVRPCTAEESQTGMATAGEQRNNKLPIISMTAKPAMVRLADENVLRVIATFPVLRSL